jgi:hypothetical protein
MPKLLAIIPEDGWAMVTEGERIFFLRPPFRSADRVPVSRHTLADAVALYGYQTHPGLPDEPWNQVIFRIRKMMVDAYGAQPLPADLDLVTRALRTGPESIITSLLDKIDGEWLAKGELAAATKALRVLLAENRVRNSPVLIGRALASRQRLDELRDEREQHVPTRPRPPRIERAALRPEVAQYKAMLALGAARMVSARR